MESSETYEISLKEIISLQKTVVSNNSITIDFGKLDSQTAGDLRNAIENVLSNRYPHVNAVAMNIK